MTWQGKFGYQEQLTAKVSSFSWGRRVFLSGFCVV